MGKDSRLVNDEERVSRAPAATRDLFLVRQIPPLRVLRSVPFSLETDRPRQ
jgi:hypothetical protein